MNEKQAQSLFFALHLGQKVYMQYNGIGPFVLESHHLSIIPHNKHLLLRSFDKITNDEAIKLASIVIDEPFSRYRRIEVSRNYAITGFPYISVHHKNVVYRFEIDCTHFNFSVYKMEELCGEVDMKPYACIDYLRSISILLPFSYPDDTGKIITLQPAEIIAKGWAKYQQ